MRSIALPRFARWLAAAACLVFSLAYAAQDLPAKFDPTRDAAKDVATAVAIAKAQGKRVMVDVGGEWCSWCRLLDNYIAYNPDVKQLVETKYVWVKVNYSPQNKNEALLARWPKIRGYPHLFVLDASGKLLHSENTYELEAENTDNAYDKAKLVAFLKQYAGK